MRCFYLSDLHLESQEFGWTLPGGDVLILAGDVCHAVCLDPARDDGYAVKQRERTLRFIDAATASFTQVLAVAGNHEHYDGVFEDTIPAMRKHLPGVTVLDNTAVDFGGVNFFGTTLWSDFEGRSQTVMDQFRRGIGDYFFVKVRAKGEGRAARFQPELALVEFDRSLAALKRHLENAGSRPTVVISHHAPSRRGLNPLSMGTGRDGAYASDLEGLIASFEKVPAWIHGHTHIQRSYRVGRTSVYVNCRGFEGRDASARTFRPDAFFDL